MTTDLLLLPFRFWPITRGRDFLFRNLVPGKFFQRYLSALPNPVTTRRGFHIFCNPNDYTSDWIKLWGEHERQTERFLLSQLNKGGVFLDIGANVGYFSLLVSHVYRQRCEVVAFEPNPFIFELLSKGCIASDAEHSLRPVPLAVADEFGTLSFLQEAQNSGHSHLVMDSEGNGTIEVPVVKVDDWLKTEMPGKRITAVKLDVEGCEMQALRGMAAMLSRDKPALIVEVVEDHLLAFGSTIAEVAEFLQSLGYRHAPTYQSDGNWYMVCK